MSVLLQAIARTGRLGVVSCITTIYGSVLSHFLFAMTVPPFNLIFPHISCETVGSSSRIVTAMWIEWVKTSLHLFDKGCWSQICGS